jgi:hemolysin III
MAAAFDQTPVITQSEPAPGTGVGIRKIDYREAEELANAVIHGLGAVLAVVGLIMLVEEASSVGRTGSTVAVLVYGAALVLLFTFSAIQHGLPLGPAKRLFVALDHAGIYLLIAGTYTPFALLLPAEQHEPLLIAIWTLATVGIVLQACAFLYGWARKYEKTAFIIYLAMGWLPLLTTGTSVFTAMETAGLVLLVGGGLAYTIGVIFYLWRKLRFSHAVWHAFVLAASVLHFLAVFYYVVPVPM